MNLFEKKEYIYSHLHHLDESVVNELYEKIFKLIENEDPVIGYNVETGQQLTRKSYLTDMEKRNKEIEKGDYISHDDLKKESKEW